MNSERRHELQENVLASYLGRITKVVEPYSKLIVGGLLVAAIGLFALSLYSSTKTEARSDATMELLQATGSGDAEVFAQVAERYPDTSAAAWARLYAADQWMASGMDQLYEDREEATTLFEDAADSYRLALQAADGTDGVARTLRSRARYGLARIAEANGDVETAVSEYEQVVAAAESDPMVELAQNRINALNQPGTQEFLSWFGEQNFAPAEPSIPPDLPDAAVLPEDPDFEIPDLDLGLETETDEGMPSGDQSENSAGAEEDSTTATEETAAEPAADDTGSDEDSVEAADEAAADDDEQ